MLRFRTAAAIACLFIIIGAAFSGAGTSDTLDQLGGVNQLAGAFIVALSAGFTVYWMNRMQLPASASQSIIGSIMGWNLFSGSVIDVASFTKIMSTWIISPVLAAGFSMVFYRIVKFIINRRRIHMLKLDFYTRAGFVLAGAFGAYSLGANNIANVMGVFVAVTPFRPIDLKLLHLSSVESLFLAGGLAVAVGVVSYSHRVMKTVGQNIVELTPVAGFVVIMSTALVLFLFSSEDLQSIILTAGLPALPLVPVSSTQAMVGAVLGIGLLKGGRGVNFRLLGRIASGWVTAPLAACLITFISLFFLQNVFSQSVFRPVHYMLSADVAARLRGEGLYSPELEPLLDRSFMNAAAFRNELKGRIPMATGEAQMRIIQLSELHPMFVDLSLISRELGEGWLSAGRDAALRALSGREFHYKWQLQEALIQGEPSWSFREDIPLNRPYNRSLNNRLRYLYRKFHLENQ
jgi:PiT family inorganic phosphate transporter